MIKVLPFNETYVKVVIDDYGTEQEFSEFFTFFMDGYKYTPKFRSGIWDGKIRLFDSRKKLIYKGLLNVVIKFAQLNDLEIKVDISLKNRDEDFRVAEFSAFVDNLKLRSKGNEIAVRPYQISAAVNALSQDRSILISPTGSGKSLIMYLCVRYLQEIDPDHKIVVVVPTTMLVEQMFSDFADYSSADPWDPEVEMQTLYSGKDKIFSKNIMITTWQSLHAMKKNAPDFFKIITDRTTVGMFDEAHVYKAKEVLATLEEFTQTKKRIGTTGTLDGTKINELCLQGLMGPIYQVTTTRDLIDEGKLSNIDVKIIKLKYSKHICEAMKGSDYQTEMNFLVGNPGRNNIIANMAKNCKGTTLVMFSFVDKHGKVIHDLIKEVVGDTRPVYFVYGGTDKDERESIRALANLEDDAIIVASEKLFSTGVNIPRIQFIIQTTPRKSNILIRQIIGRGLRLFEGKDKMVFYDIADDLSVGRKRNITLNSLDDRLAVYIKDEFPFKTIEVDMAKFGS